MKTLGAQNVQQNILLTIDELREATAGTILERGAANGVVSISIDSRTCTAGSLFVPLRGMQQDGHAYCEAALKNGAVCFFVDSLYISDELHKNRVKELCSTYKATAICVQNNLTALQNCAKLYLRKFPKLLRIAVTGSSGKTTTKELLAAIFKQQYNTIYSKGNLNSETGLPLSAFTVRSDNEVAIFEMGMNRKNEIAELAACFNPDAAVITNIGTAHIGMLGNQENIALEKKKIFLYFDSHCVGFITKSPYSELLKEKTKGTIVEIDIENEIKNNFLNLIDKGVRGFEFEYCTEKIFFNLIGKHNLANAMLAVKVAEHFGISSENIAKGLNSIEQIAGRSEIVHGGVCDYLCDVYNANLESTLASLDFLQSIHSTGKKIAVLGSMLELGDFSIAAHTSIIKRAVVVADIVFLYGNEMIAAADKIKTQDKKITCFTSDEAEKLKAALMQTITKNDFVLLKGSHGLHLEQFTSVLEAKHES